MIFKNIRQIVRSLGFDVVRYDKCQTGKDPFIDMSKFVHEECPVIFDVGANIGQSIRKFRAQFPTATIHSFEPSPTTFEILRNNNSNLSDVHLWNCAMGAFPQEMTFLENSHSEMSSFLPLSEFGWGNIEKETLVEVMTIDQFCIDMNINRIDILKSDTQGFDLEVLLGAERTIRSNKIGVIYFEPIFSDMYKDLPSFDKVYSFLIKHDFLLVSFYDIHYQKHLASWADALFVHKSVSNNIINREGLVL